MHFLEVERLSVLSLNKPEPEVIVGETSFVLEKGKTLALVGESGSGKTTLCRALTRLFPPSMKHTLHGTVRFNDVDLLTCTDENLRDIRRREIRYVFQEPQQALNPALSIRTQMALASDSDSNSEDAVHEALHSVGLESPHEVMRLYPHQLSIGMAQRVMIAMAVLPHPSLLIADEPTSALDASLRFQLLDLLKSLQLQNGMAMILVTHDLAIARKYADDIAVMRDGVVLELSSSTAFFQEPSHPYSQLLLRAANELTLQIEVGSHT